MIACKTLPFFYFQDKTCVEYQADLLNDVKNQKELLQTEAAVKEMLAKGNVITRIIQIN